MTKTMLNINLLFNHCPEMRWRFRKEKRIKMEKKRKNLNPDLPVQPRTHKSRIFSKKLLFWFFNDLVNLTLNITKKKFSVKQKQRKLFGKEFSICHKLLFSYSFIFATKWRRYVKLWILLSNNYKFKIWKVYNIRL